MIHLCPEEIALLAAAQQHVHCLICWVRVWGQWVKCRLTGHERSENARSSCE